MPRPERGRLIRIRFDNSARDRVNEPYSVYLPVANQSLGNFAISPIGKRVDCSHITTSRFAHHPRHYQEECPWADVVELLPDGRWQGRIVNYLMYARGYEYGEVVTFERMSDGSRWWWQPLETAQPKAVN